MTKTTKRPEFVGEKSKVDFDQKTSIIIATVIFILTTSIFFGDQLFGDKYFWEDFLEYVYPTQNFAAVESSQGKIPFWNPYIFNGMPFVADLQVGFFYPLNRLMNFFIADDGHLSVGALQFLVIFHFFIAQMAMFLLLRHIKVSIYGAMIGAITYSFSMMIVCHVIHPMIVYHIAWFPLVFMLFKKAIDTGNIKTGVGGGLIFGFSMLSGHPQSSLYLGLLLGFYLIYRLIINFKSKVQFKLPILVAPILTFVFAAAIFQVQFLMSGELAELSNRAEMTYEDSTEGSLAMSQLFQAVVPDLFGKVDGMGQNEFPFYMKISPTEDAPYYAYWETAYYFGLLALILGLLTLVYFLKERDIAFYLFIIIFGVLFALGSSGIIHGIFYNLPFFGQFRVPARMMFFVVFAFSILSAIGFDKLFFSNLPNKFKKLLIVSAVPIFVLLLGLTGILTSMVDVPASYMPLAASNSLIGLFIIVVLLGLSYVTIKNNGALHFSGGLLVLLVFLDLYAVGSKFNDSPQSPAQAYELENATLNLFKFQSPDNLFRVNTRSYNPPVMAFKRNQGYMDNIMTTEGYNPLVLRRVNPAVNDVNLIYDLLNVKYKITLDQQTRGPVFVENPTMFPRFWYVFDWDVIGENEVESFMKSNQIDYRKKVILEEQPKIARNLASNDSLLINIKCMEYSGNYQRYEVMNPEADFILVLSEIWYPAWKVFVDGMPAKLHRANYSLRAVEIPKGASKIEFRFASPSFAIGQWITLIALIIAIPLLFFKFSGKNKNE
ncbi:MAG: YfhO family protein [Candidatus Kapabacteria bacterium]|nr:YfhO family protein [Candidatus Kapabacteria bacterium]